MFDLIISFWFRGLCIIWIDNIWYDENKNEEFICKIIVFIRIVECNVNCIVVEEM